MILFVRFLFVRLGYVTMQEVFEASVAYVALIRVVNFAPIMTKRVEPNHDFAPTTIAQGPQSHRTR